MANERNADLRISTNGQIIPRMQEITSSVGGTRGATIPPLQPTGTGQASGGSGSSGSTGQTGSQGPDNR